MQEPNDKDLHDWVRQTLHNYQPDYDPQDWNRMQRSLRKQNWLRKWLPAGAGLVLVGLVVWYLIPMNPFKPTTPEAGTVAPSGTLEGDSISSLPFSATHTNAQPELRPTEAAPSTPASGYSRGKLELDKRVIWPESDLLSPRTTPLTMNDLPLVGPPKAPTVNPEEKAIRQQMLTGQFGQDSTTYRTLARNLRRWPNAVIVCDLTSSMYPYSTQLFAWFRKNARHPSVKALVFFTDCDSLGRQTQPGGPAGQMFVTRSSDAKLSLPVMIDAARNTMNNGDEAENDLEALLFAQRTFPDASHLILLADNSSPVKDMTLLNQIHKPVHVVLCGTTNRIDQAFQPEYLTLTKHTSGSLHTLEDDLNPKKMDSDTWMRVGEKYYRYNVRKGKFGVTGHRQRPRRFMGLFWL
jgi:hypothetical protein